MGFASTHGPVLSSTQQSLRGPEGAARRSVHCKDVLELNKVINALTLGIAIPRAMKLNLNGVIG